MCLHGLEISSLSGAQGPYGVLGGVSLQGGIRSASCRGSLSPAKALGKLDKATGEKVLPGHELTLTPSSSLPQAQWFPQTPAKSVVALKTPIKVELVAGKTYRWCVCGHSKKQVRDLCPPSR